MRLGRMQPREDAKEISARGGVRTANSRASTRRSMNAVQRIRIEMICATVRGGTPQSLTIEVDVIASRSAARR
jgi:hypothetical protein